jgi:hypothetical protein
VCNSWNHPSCIATKCDNEIESRTANLFLLALLVIVKLLLALALVLVGLQTLRNSHSISEPKKTHAIIKNKRE